MKFPVCGLRKRQSFKGPPIEALLKNYFILIIIVKADDLVNSAKKGTAECEVMQSSVPISTVQ